MDGVLRDPKQRVRARRIEGFNPCSNGWCTSSPQEASRITSGTSVSILVLMDGVLRDKRRIVAGGFAAVSILVLMDGVLRVRPSGREVMPVLSFNPCSNGWCTSSAAGIWMAAPISAFQSLF